MTRLECIEAEKAIYDRSFDRLLKRMKDSIFSADKSDFKYILNNEIDLVSLQRSYAYLLYYQEQVRLHPESKPYRNALQYFKAAFKAKKEQYETEQNGGLVWIQPSLFEGGMLCEQYGKNRLNSEVSV